MEIIINIVAFFVLLKVAVYLVIFQRLIGLSLQYPGYSIKKSEDIPVYLVQVFQSVIEQFQLLEFEFCHYLDIDEIDVGNKRWGILLYNSQYQSYITLSIAFPPDKNSIINLTCYTFFQDDTSLITFNGEADALLGEIPNTIIENIYAITFEEQWQAHLRKLQALAKTAKLLSATEFVFQLKEQLILYMDSLEKRKKLIKKNKENFYIAVPTALKIAAKVMQYTSKKAALSKKKNKLIQTDFVVPLELEIQAFLRRKTIKEIKARQDVRHWIFAFSLVVFILAGQYFWGIQYTFIITFVIFLHELGHFFAMKCYGYRDTSIFFLPLFGAATVGHKENISVSEEVFVLMAGPVPSLLLGIVLLFFIPELNGYFINENIASQFNINPKQLINFTKEFIEVLLIINWINLLPIYPLDGGKIVNILFFVRYPYLDIIFKIITVFISLALFRLSPVFLILGIVTALSILPTFRQVKILRYLKLKQRENLAKNDFYQLAFEAIKVSGYDFLSFEKKCDLIEKIEKNYYQPVSTWIEKSILSFSYLLFLLGSLATIIIIRFYSMM